MEQWGAAHYAAALVASLASVSGVWVYRRFALRRGIIARISARGLHDRVVPRGGGIVFGAVFALLVVAAWLSQWLTSYEALAFGAGGAAAAAVGFIDDLREIPPVRKLAVQAALSLWLFVCFYRPLLEPLTRDIDAPLRVATFALVLFVPVWMINLHNFIDGVDGLASSAAVFVSAAALLVLSLTDGPVDLLVLFALLGAAASGFMILNLPPARVFMGDAGSIFLGYAVSALLLLSVLTGALSVWTWLAMLSYYIGDTTTTTLSRIFLVPHNWYGVHRSHAYQNLARVRKSHALVTYGLAAYNLLWSLPLAVTSALRPDLGPAAAALALLPPVLWALRFGPRYASD